MKNELNVKTGGIVGCGLIGMSWAAYYLAKGFSVRATDPVAGAEEKLRAYINSAWTLLEEMGLEPGADKNNLTFSTNLKESLKGVDFERLLQIRRKRQVVLIGAWLKTHFLQQSPCAIDIRAQLLLGAGHRIGCTH